MMPRRTAFFAALFTLVALTGCGTDNTLSGLDDSTDAAPPSAPSNVREVNRGSESLLAWDASPDADVVGYDVYVYMPDPAREAAYVKLNSSTITDEEFSVTNSGTLESWYRVKAVDQTGNRSSSSNAAYIDGGYPTGGQEPGGDELPVVR